MSSLMLSPEVLNALLRIRQSGILEKVNIASPCGIYSCSITSGPQKAIYLQAFSNSAFNSRFISCVQIYECLRVLSDHGMLRKLGFYVLQISYSVVPGRLEISVCESFQAFLHQAGAVHSGKSCRRASNSIVPSLQFWTTTC